jgi:hypothetical protein
MSNIKLFYPADPVYKKPEVDQAELDRHKAEFLKAGGKIQHVPAGMTADRQRTMKELDNVNWALTKDKESKIFNSRRQSEIEKRQRRQAQGRI